MFRWELYFNLTSFRLIRAYSIPSMVLLILAVVFFRSKEQRDNDCDISLPKRSCKCGLVWEDLREFESFNNAGLPLTKCASLFVIM